MSDIKENRPESDELIEQIIAEGKVVFSHNWDSGGPGAGAGCERVYHRKGKFVICSLDFGTAGPFASLDEALQEQNLLTVTGATTSIDCLMVASTELATRLECEEDGYQIEINGELWVYRARKREFQRKLRKR